MTRGKLIALVALCGGLAPSVSVAEETATARIGEPASSRGANLASTAAAACDESALPGIPGGGKLKRYKLTFLAGYTEYDPETCKPHGAGSWVVASQEQCDGKPCGTVTLGVLANHTLSSGSCAGHSYDFASLCYTWTRHSDAKITDTVNA